MSRSYIPKYTSRSHIMEELEYCKQVFRKIPALRTIDVTNRSIEEIGEVAVLLQTGKDRQAMETIIRFSELFQCLVRIFSSLKLTAKNHSRIGGKSFDTFFTELNLMLEELLEAFNHQDSVLIGDLLEYEIAPRLEELKDFTEGSI